MQQNSKAGILLLASYSVRRIVFIETSAKATMHPVSPACRLCINFHQYAPARIVLEARFTGRWVTRSAAAVMVRCQVLSR